MISEYCGTSNNGHFYQCTNFSSLPMSTSYPYIPTSDEGTTTSEISHSQCPFTLNVSICRGCAVLYFTGDCGDPPDVENGFISHISIKNITTLTYECTDGYFFQEGVEYNTFRTCLSSSDWSEEIVSCSKLNSC